MVGKDDAGDRGVGRQRDFERVTSYLAGNGAGDRKACLCIVEARRQDQGRPAPAPFMPGLRIEREPDEISSIGYVGPRYHSSCPTAVVPQSIAPWRLARVIFDTRVLSE